MEHKRSLNSSGSLKPILITAVLAVVGTLFTAYFTQEWRDKSEFKFHLYDQRLQAFTELMGVRIVLPQLAMSFQESKIFRGYHKAAWELTHNRGYLEEAQRQVLRIETLNSDLTKERKRLYELVASIAVLFPRSQELEVLISKMRQIGIMKDPPSPKDIHKVSALEEWRDKQQALAQEHIEIEFGNPIGQLVDHLDAFMKKESLN